MFTPALGAFTTKAATDGLTAALTERDGGFGDYRTSGDDAADGERRQRK
jgi:hypothetical protein